MIADETAARIVEALGLLPHPEGGWYRETFRDVRGEGRAHSTAIFYLLEQGQVSTWHRVRDASETWHHYAGGPLRLRLAEPGGPVSDQLLGPELLDGQSPQIVVPAGWWQAAEPLGAWTLVGCTVAPAFQFESFELAPDGWSPG
jgi:predicted cupin superfamily sugar epimerase